MPAEQQHLAPPSKIDFFDLDSTQIDTLVKSWGWPVFRAQQLRDWVYKKDVTDPAALTNLSRSDRAIIHQTLTFGGSAIPSEQITSAGTPKFLLVWPDG